MKSTDEASCANISVRLSLSFSTLILAASSVVILANSRNIGQVNRTASTITGGGLVGLWRGRWEESLRPRFKKDKDVDSSPVWLRFQMEGGKLTGVAIHDYIGLSDSSEAGVKILHLIKREEEKLFDLKLNRDTLSFKQRFGGRDIESQLEITGENSAQLKY